MKKYTIATLGTILFIPVITIGAELHKPLKDLLKNIFWHHWLGKSVLVIAVFALPFIIFSLFFIWKKNTEKENAPDAPNATSSTSFTGITAITIVAFLSALIIFAFFTFEYFTHLS